MSSPQEHRPFFLRLLDAYLQEENIKWVLGLGVCILLGSSLRLVTLHWVDYTPVWKYLILLGYSVAVFVLGEIGYHRLRLRKTGTVLMSLTVLLIPISFLALHWIQAQADPSAIDHWRDNGLIALLGVNLVWSAFAAHRIFLHFLRRAQPTFLVCYLTLCLLGAITPGLPKEWGPLLTLITWAVFTTGTVKVNRHIFWLTEEQRLPRIFGFFPILLLGSQFVVVMVLGLSHQVTLPWLGLICTLVALPVLLTADAVASVFQQRTGGLVRPIPWSISGPLAIGVTLTTAGVILGLTGWPASGLIVPTAMIAAVSFGVIGKRTQKSAFVWGMVVCILLTYQTCPVFFKELVLQVRDQAAAAVRESRLPYAFYGLTYAPLIAIFSLVAAYLQRRRQALFAGPLQATATGLACLLLVVSFTHTSALLPVALLLCPMFVMQAVLFRSRPYVIPAAIAFLVAAYGAPLFAVKVWGWDVSTESALLVWISALTMLLMPGALCDRMARSLKWPFVFERPFELNAICQLFSLAGTIGAACVWGVQFGSPTVMPEFGLGLLVPVSICLLLAVHSLRWLKLGLGEFTLAFATYCVQLRFMAGAVTPIGAIELLALTLLTLWCVSYALERIPATRLARAFGPASFHVSMFGLAILFALFEVIWVAQHRGSMELSSTISLLMLVWGLDASRRVGNWKFATLTWGSVFVYSSAVLAQLWGPVVASPWWMATWVLTGFILLGVRQLLTTGGDRKPFAWSDLDDVFNGQAVDHCPTKQDRMAAWIAPLDVLVPLVFLAVGTISIVYLQWPCRVAGIAAIVGLGVARRLRLTVDLGAVVWPLLNWQLLAIVAMVIIRPVGSETFDRGSGIGEYLILGRERYSMVHAQTIFEITPADLLTLGMPIAGLTAISAWVFESRRLRQRILCDELILIHQAFLLLISALLLMNGVDWPQGNWTAINIYGGLLAWLGIVGTTLTAAVRTQNRDLVVWGLVAGLGGLAYFHINGVLDLSTAVLEYVLLIAGIAYWNVGKQTINSQRFAILSEPFQWFGFVLPMAVLPICVIRHAVCSPMFWEGANSLPLLGASAFYFWHGMERKNLGTTILSAVILNVAGLLLWSELHWTDPQLFLMPVGLSILVITEVMRREIPVSYHGRLRFIGSLIILVSPTFNIVTGSWLHILTLMIASALLALIAIGLRVRTLLYTSTAFLLADLVALVARSSMDEPTVLWVAGVALGASIIALGAICENHRETLLARLRGLAAELQQWA